MECEYCKTILKTNYALKLHQKTAKYCLALHGGVNSNNYDCPDCGKQFTIKSSLDRHFIGCSKASSKFKDEIDELKKELAVTKLSLSEAVKREQEMKEDFIRREKELREDYATLAAISAKKSTKTTINNNTVNLGVFDKTQDDIKRIVDENYNKQYLIQGQKGVAMFTSKHILDTDSGKPPIYAITDRSRGNGKYKISENEVVTDTGMTGLTKKVQPSIKRKAIGITGSEPNPFETEDLLSGYHEVAEMDQDNSIFRNCLVKELTT